MAIKAVVFDLDGVLVDACEIHYIALNKALKQVTGYEISRKDHDTVFNGLPTRVKLNDLAANGRISLDHIAAVSDLKQKLTIDAIRVSVKEDQTKIRLMNFLLNKKLKIGCYTNAVRESAELMLGQTGVLRMIQVLITNEDVKVCKPDPTGYKLIFKKLDTEPEEVIVVDDSCKGIEAAERAGAKVIEVGSAREVNIALLKQRLDYESCGSNKRRG